MAVKDCMKKVLMSGLSVLMAVSMFNIPARAQENRAADGVTTLGTIESMDDIQVSDNVVDISTSNAGEKIKITFVSDTIFRLNVEPEGKFVEEPETARDDYVAKMLVKPISEYEGVVPNVSETDTDYVIGTDKVELVISKADSRMRMINAQTDEVVWSEKAPLQYGNGKTTQTLNEGEDEYFFGGGFQNGYFSHKNQKLQINIVATSGNWGDGMVSSPTPFYMSTNGYGVMRYTWRNGVYDFGYDDPTTTTTMHNEERFDGIYFLGDIPSVLDQYTDLTGKPVMLPEYSYYLGHANCYNRDYWVEDPNGKYEINGVRYTEKGSSNPGGNAFLETLNDTPVSARTVLDWYQQEDMPLGWFLPNDGYGCGYGQDDTDSTPDTADAEAIDINVNNLKRFTDYANSKGVEVGLWTQSDLKPTLYDNEGKVIAPHLRRDVEKEVNIGGVRAVKTDVAWVGSGFSMALNSVKTAADTIEEAQYRPFVVSLFGWNGTQRYATIWSGDQKGGLWEYIRFHIPSYIGAGLSGIPYVGSDMDGIYGGDAPIIQTRDYQWKAFTPVMIDMDGWGSTVKNPAANGGIYASINRMYLKLKAQMLPYNYSNTYEANQTGMPLIRAMLLEYPEDPNTYTTMTQYQYMWGENLLIAPIYQDTASDDQGNDIRNDIYLPDEDQVWIDYFTGEQYQGGRVINGFDAPVWKTPVFVKNGAIIPMAEENNSPAGVKGASPRIFEVWPSGETDFTLFEDDGYSTDYYNGAYALTNITSNAPKSGSGTATIHVDAADTNGQDYAEVTKFDKERETQFVVNVQERPESISAEVGGKAVEFKEVGSETEFNEAEGNVYFYNEAPNLNKYNLEGEAFADTKIITTPKLYVKIAANDVSANAIDLTIEGFNNTMAPKDDGSTAAPAVPEGLHAVEEGIQDTSLQLQWDPVEGENGASYYELRVNGENGYVLSNLEDTTFVHGNLTQATEYTYEVRAVNTAGKSAWSEPISVSTQLDRYRNVVPDFSLTSPSANDGTTTNLTNRDMNDMWFSKFDNNNAEVAKGEKYFYFDLKEVYQMDKLELYGVTGYTSGNITNATIETSIDGIHYTTLLDHVNVTWTDKNLRAEIDLKGASMRYMRMTVHQPYNSWLALSEVMPYKVDGSKPAPMGDVNGDRQIDEGDMTFMSNYVGVNSASTTWVQVSQADFNGNGLIDGFDLAFVAANVYGQGSSSQDVAGSIVAIPSKNHLKAGEEFTIDIYGNGFNDVNSLSFQLEDVNNHFTINNRAESADALDGMIVYPMNYGSRVTLAATNRGGSGAKLNGNMKIATIKAAAKVDTVFDMELTNAIIVGPGLSEASAIAAVVDPDTEMPAVDDQTRLLVNRKDFTLSSSTPDKFQSGYGLENIADGSLATVSELKWNAGAECPLNWTFNLSGEKEISSMIVYKRPNGNGSLKKIEMIAYHNGEEVARELKDNIENGAESVEFTLPENTMVDKVEFNALDSHQASDSTKYMTLREIELYGRNNSVVTGIEADDSNVYTMDYDTSMIYRANVLPATALNRQYTVTSSDPNLIRVSRIQDESGNISYLLTAAESGEEGAKVTITAKAVAGDFSVSKEITLGGGSTQPEYGKLPESMMSASASSECPDGYENHGKAYDVLDNDASTYWHSDWTVDGHTLPQWVMITLDQPSAISQMDVLPRDSGNGSITDYEIYVSETGEDDSFVLAAKGTWDGGTDLETVKFDEPFKNITAVKLVALGSRHSSDANNVAAVAEIDLYGKIGASEITKDALNEAIAAAEKISADEYTTSSWNTLQQALTAAKDVAADDSADQETIDAAAAALNSAVEALQVKASQPSLDALQNMVEKAEALEGYTEEELKDVNAAVAAAKALIEDPDDASSAAVVAVTLQLSEAISDLSTLPSIDALRKDLQDSIDFVKENILNDTEGLRPGKVQALKDAVKAAEDVLKDADASREELIAASKAITKAAHELWEIVSKAELNALIEAAKGYAEEEYTEESFAALSKALEVAKATAIDEDASVDEVTQAITGLATAIAGLEKVTLDTSALEYEIDLAEEMLADIDSYIPSTVEGLKEKLDDAKNALETATDQTQIDEATRILREARLSARTKADKSALEAAIDAANSFDLSLYTADSAKDVKTALKKAEAMMSKEDATQEEVNATVAALNAAVNKLVKEEVNAPDVQDPSIKDPAQGADQSVNAVPDKTDTAAQSGMSAMFAVMLAAGAGAALLALRKKRS